MRCGLRFELWRNSDSTEYSFFPCFGNYNEHLADVLSSDPDSDLIWSCQSNSYFKAMQMYYDYMGFGEYKPEPDWPDTIYED